MSTHTEILKRRTFAIISHPDAGKTTLTEKLLLFGGAIQTAGAVKSNKIKKTATSDFMEIEKQRGISVATSVMVFDYKGVRVNLLDTPGHKDFAEDTYRTLSAVDSVILVIDCVKGVEAQTERLMEVCRMRNTPVIVFINKMDRDGRDPFDLLEELEEKLFIKLRPLAWPIGMGSTFKGVYNLHEQTLNLFQVSKSTIAKEKIKIENLDDPNLVAEIGQKATETLKDDIELIETMFEPFDKGLYQDALLAPVFFGSGVNNFGVQELLDTFIEIAPTPTPRISDKREVFPTDDKFSGFVFKIHANLDPRHRDRIAFLRVCSGKFERNKFFHHVRLDKAYKFTNPYTFLAQEKSVIEEAYPGDVIGLYDTGNFKIGDTLTEGENFFFKGIPSFSPELFKEVVNADPMKSKQLEKGLLQLTDEGVAQLFIQKIGNRKIIGTVGELQFEVIQHRLLNEYGAKCNYHHLNYYKACWLTTTDKKRLEEFILRKSNQILYDKDENPVFMADSEWTLRTQKENFPELTFHTTSEFKIAAPVV